MSALRCVLLVAVLLSGVAVAAADTPRAPADARVQRVSDQLEIMELLLEYGRTLDRKDYAAYGKLFARDGEWIGGGPAAKGPAGIEEKMRKTFGPGSGVKWTTDFHVFSNPIIKVDGDKATAWSRWLFVSPGANGHPVIMYGGHYDDVLVREDGVWRFRRREVISDIAPGPKGRE
jgi:hypothetical protein